MKYSQIISRTIKLVVLALLLSACSQGAPISMGNTANPINFQPLWSRQIGSGTAGQYLRLSPAYAQGVLYIDDARGNVFALNAQTGKTRWRLKTGYALSTGVVVGAQALFIGTSGGKLIALTKMGKILWTQTVSNGIFSPPVLTDNRVIVKTLDDRLFAFTQNYGHLLWNFSQASPPVVWRLSSAPLVIKNKLIAGFASGKLMAFNLANGKVLWQYQLALPQGPSLIQHMADIDSTPLWHKNVLYVATYRGKIAAIALKKRRLLWRYPFSTLANLALHKSYLYAADTQGRVWSFAADDGSVFWRQNNLSDEPLSGVAAVGSVVLLGDKRGDLYFLATNDGHVLFQQHIANAAITSAPLIVGANIYVFADNGRVLAYRYEDLR